MLGGSIMMTTLLVLDSISKTKKVDKPDKLVLSNYTVKYQHISHPIQMRCDSSKHLRQLVSFQDENIIKKVNLLYKMGYMPFFVKAYTPMINGDKTIFKGIISWDNQCVPDKLMSLVGSVFTENNILYKSAVKRFERDTGSNGASYNYMKLIYNFGHKAKKPFVWVYVVQNKRPEKLYVWQSGYDKDNGIVFTSLVNTGVMHTTVPGDFMIYIRLKKTEMRGYFPSTGKYYDDPDIPWVNYFDKGEAIHGYPRASYGFPQSAGCVELPIRKSKELYPILYKYAIVSVSGF